jgi:hypothetical protein
VNLKPFAIEYRHAGKLWHMTLEATDHDDAMARLRSAFVDGEPLERVAVSAAADNLLSRALAKIGLGA